LIINELCEGKVFFVEKKILFTFAAIEIEKKKASKCAVPERMAHLKAISTKKNRPQKYTFFKTPDKKCLRMHIFFHK
jgi:hypothetical protein